ncbi:hypothetical protein EDC26_103289 [Paralcaligenes ureilyticus]|uniref:Uncharacterized protein n=1 Tax=Paralcaligenes ureilyticus TaxID=627131 RepID=A0A4R3M8G1_9BURK|nr:hypothetical protein EDC26_103289 [Paralcaligenes ureilyticus]
MGRRSTEIVMPAGKLLVSQQPMRQGLPLDLRRHIPIKHTVRHSLHLFIDRGAFRRTTNTCFRILDCIATAPTIRL